VQTSRDPPHLEKQRLYARLSHWKLERKKFAIFLLTTTNNQYFGAGDSNRKTTTELKEPELLFATTTKGPRN
jgi:hypothetical protein